jgi:hypothetical protein
MYPCFGGTPLLPLDAAFVRPFDWSLWLALLLTLLAFPAVVFAIEFFSLRKRIHRSGKSSKRRQG